MDHLAQISIQLFLTLLSMHILNDEHVHFVHYMIVYN